MNTKNIAGFLFLILAFTQIYAQQLPAAWENYFGKVQGQVVDNWGLINRNSKFSLDKASDYEKVKSILKTHDLMYGCDIELILNNNQKGSFSSFLNRQLKTNGADCKEITIRLARKLIRARGENKTNIYWQLGNEVNSQFYQMQFKNWCAENKLAYPHPKTKNFSGKDEGNANDQNVILNDVGYVGYFMDLYVAPTVEAINEINDSLPAGRKIIMIAGSVANFRNPVSRDVWLPAMMNYEFDGRYASSIAGKKYYQLVDGISFHYLFAEFRQGGLDERNPTVASRQQLFKSIYDEWTSPLKPGNRIQNIFITEELGNKVIRSGRGAYFSAIIFASFIDVCARYQLLPIRVKLLFYGSEVATGGAGDPMRTVKTEIPTTAGNYAMSLIENYVPGSKLKSCPDILRSDKNIDFERYAFKDESNNILLFYNTPQPQDETNYVSKRLNKISLNGITDNYLPTAVLLDMKGEKKIELTTLKLKNKILEVQLKGSDKFHGTLIIYLKKK